MRPERLLFSAPAVPRSDVILSARDALNQLSRLAMARVYHKRGQVSNPVLHGMPTTTVFEE